MSLASLTIDLVAGLAKFEQDLKRAVSLSEKAAGDIKSSAQGIGEVFSGSFLSNFATEAIHRLAALPGELVDSIAGFKDLEDKTGASAEALAKWQGVADLSGTSLEAIGNASVKLTGELSKIGDGGNIAGGALKALGINLADFKKLSPDQQLDAVAKSMDNFGDGAGKTAISLALFGKSGAELLPFLKDLGEAGEQQVKLTQAQIERVDEFTKKQARLRTEFRNIAQVVVAEGLPAFVALTEVTRDTIKAFLGMDEATGDLDPKQVAQFADDTAHALARVVDAGDGVVRTFQIIGKVLGAAAAQASFIVSGEFREAAQVGREVREEIDAILEKPLFSSKVDEQLKKLRETAGDDVGGKKKPKLTFAFDSEAEGKIKATKKAYDELVGEIGKRTSATEAELNAGEKLTDGQKYAVEVVTKLASAEAGFNDQQKRSITVLLEGHLAREKTLEQQREGVKLTQEATRALAQQIAGYADSTKSLRFQAEEVGKTADEVTRLRLAREAQTIADREGRLEALKTFGLTEEKIAQEEILIQSMKDELAARRGITDDQAARSRDPYAGASKAVRDYLEGVGKAGDETERAVKGAIGALENDLTTSFRNGKLDVSSFVDTVLNEMIRLAVIKPLLADIFGKDGEKAGGFFGGLFKPGGGLLSGLASLFAADGAAFDIAGARPFAAGGVFDSPHFFKFASGGALNTGVLGEAGPEAIMPLKRGPGGKLGVVASGGRGGINVQSNVTVNIDGSTDPARLQQYVQAGVAEGNKQLVEQLQAQGRL